MTVCTHRKLVAGLLISSVLSVSSIAAQCETELAALSTAAALPKQFSGRDVAVEGDTIVVGAHGELIFPSNNRAYVWVGSGGTWPTFPQTLYYNDANQIDNEFGASVAIAGGKVAVGAPRHEIPGYPPSGRVVVWEPNASGQYLLTAELNAPIPVPNELFGEAVAMAGDILIAGAPTINGNGTVYALQRQPDASWTHFASLTSPDGHSGTRFGSSVAFDGQTLVVGAKKGNTSSANNTGAGYIYEVGGLTITYKNKIEAPNLGNFDEFAMDVDVSGDWVIASDGRNNKAQLYQRTVSTWPTLPTQTLSPGDWVHAVAIDGDELLVGLAAEGPDGEVHNYRNVGTWVLENQLVAPPTPPSYIFGAGFGQAVDLDGVTAAIGAPSDDGIWSTSVDRIGTTYVWALDGDVGEEYCPGVPNSTGQPGVIAAEGSYYLSLNCLTLKASQLPGAKPAIFIMGSNQGFVPNHGGGVGTLCISAPFIRFPLQTTLDNGTLTQVLDFSNLPGGASFLSGQEWNFQVWHRDAASTNLSGAIAVTFR